MLLGIIDEWLKEKHRVKVETEKLQINNEDTVSEKKIESSESSNQKKASVWLGLQLVSYPVLILSYWFIGLENIIINILGYILLSLLGLLIFLVLWDIYKK